MENHENQQGNPNADDIRENPELQNYPNDLEKYVANFWAEEECDEVQPPEEPEMQTQIPEEISDTDSHGQGAWWRDFPYEKPYHSWKHPDEDLPEEEAEEFDQFLKSLRKPFWKRRSFWKKVGAVAALIALMVSCCAVTAQILNSHWERELRKLEQSFQSHFNFLEEEVRNIASSGAGHSVSGTVSVTGGLTAAQVYAQNVDSVVMIESTVVSNYYGQSSTGVSAGSGFIITADGYVVTNFHVIEGANAVSVILVDGRKFAARVVGYDSTNDIAVLKIEAAGLNPVTLGSSNDLIVGDQVVAIGNPLGSLTSTLTVGYVSAKERSVSTDGTHINMIQTDAAINSGNSGGPLFNMRGEVIGITTAKYSGQSSSGATIEGIGFAIPISDVAGAIEQLVTHGYIKAAYMGVVVQNMDESVASIYSLPVGAYVASVEPGGPAEKAGIQAKDIIVAVDGVPVRNLTDLTLALRQYEPGDEATVTIFRAGAEHTVRVVFVQRPADAG